MQSETLKETVSKATRLNEEKGWVSIVTAALPYLILIAAIVTPLFLENVYYIQIMGFVGIFSLLAIGLNLVVGIADTFSLGHQAFYALGAYATALLSTRLGMPFLVTLIAGAAVAGLFGLLIGPVMRLRGPFLAVATLAFGEIVYLILLNWIPVTNGPNGISGIPWPALGPLQFDTITKMYYLILFFVILEALVIHRLIRSRAGRAMKAMRDNERAAEATGVHVAFYKVLSFVIAAVFAGIAGTVYAYFISFVSPDAFTLTDGIEMLFMIVVGGLGSVPGSIIGATVVALLPEILRPLYEYRLIAYSVIMILILIFAPKGIYGLLESGADWMRARLDRVKATAPEPEADS